VLGWSAEETARILETTVPAVKNALARARQTLALHPSGGEPADVRDLAATDAEVKETIAQWVDAFEKGNTARMVELLTEDGTAAHSLKERQTGYNTLKQKAMARDDFDKRNDKKQEEITHGERTE
jgi:hypothetical protein